jgi:hypothetical protein
VAGIKKINLAVYHAANDLIAFGKGLPEEGSLRTIGRPRWPRFCLKAT